MIYAGTITEIQETHDNRLVYRVVGAGGHTFFPVYNVGTGGFHGVFSHFPIVEGSEVIVCEMENKGFYLLGGLSDPRDLRTISKTEKIAGEEEDVTGVNVEDTHIKNTNSYLQLSPANGATIKGSDVRIQLSTGKLRVSKQGQAQNEVLNATPFLDALFTYIAEMEERINTLSDVVKVVGTELLTEYNALVLNNTNPPRLAELTALGVGNPLFAVNVATLSFPLSASSSAKTNSESTKNPHIKVP